MPNQFNLTNLTEASDFVGLIDYGNEVTSDMFGLIILLGIFITLFGASRSIGTEDKNAFIVGTFGTMMSSWLFYVMGLVGISITLFMMALMFASVLVIWFRGKD